MIKFCVLSIFPNMFNEFKSTSIIKRAIEAEKAEINLIDIRDFTLDKHKRVDFPPCGGGAGMVMAAEPLGRAIDHAISLIDSDIEKIKIIYLSPRGKVLNYSKSKSLADEDMNYILICGHYEGIDERIIEEYNIEEISIGDYVLTGGELPAMVLMDSIIRLIPGVIDEESLLEESHTNNLLEYPQYTKPVCYKGRKVPEVLLSGNHEKVNQFRKLESIKVTYKNRPELIYDALDKKLISRNEIEKVINLKGGENNGHN